MGGSPNQGTQTTQTIPSPGAQALDPYVQQFAKSYGNQGGTNLPGFSPVAQFTDPQKQGQQMALSQGAPAQQTAANSALGAQQFLTTGAALDPSTNPGLMKSIQFAQLPVQQQFQENTIPTLRSNATAVGGLGSSREGIAEGIAARGEEQSLGNIAAGMTNQNYLNALDQMTRAMGLTPSVQGAQITPATTVSGVGDVQQAMDQANRAYAYQSALFPQENLLATAQALAGIEGALPGGTTTSTGTGTTNPQPWQYALGAGSLLSGLGGPAGISSLGSSIGSGLSSLGSGMGSLLPFLMMA